MIKKTLKVLVGLAALVILWMGFQGSFQNSAGPVSDTACYRLQGNFLDEEVLHGYPQTVMAVEESMTPRYILQIENSQNRSLVAPIPEEYPDSVREYLHPSEKVDWEHPSIVQVAAGIAPGEEDAVEIARQAAFYVASIIEYDEALAQAIWEGTSNTRSASETLATGKGTCSEYVNLFMAIMRIKGIPARFVTGIVSGGSYHAWAEIWLADIGWFPVETQQGKLGVSSRHIRLLVGVDFARIGIPLQEIQAHIEGINP